jgi:hypothetical protein
MARGRRPTRDAANTVTRCSHPDDSEAWGTRDPADALTADESGGNERRRKPLTDAGIHPDVLDDKAPRSGFRTGVDGPAR